MKVYEVGQKYDELRTLADGAQFDMTDGGGILKIGFNGVSTKEVQAIKEGKLTYSLYEKEGIMFLIWNFNGISSIDTPFTIHQSKAEVLNEVGDGQGYAVTIYFYDTKTGELKAIRYISWNTNFSRKFKELAEKQSETNYDKVSYMVNLENVYRQLSTNQMEKRAVSYGISRRD